MYLGPLLPLQKPHCPHHAASSSQLYPQSPQIGFNGQPSATIAIKESHHVPLSPCSTISLSAQLLLQAHHQLCEGACCCVRRAGGHTGHHLNSAALLLRHTHAGLGVGRGHNQVSPSHK